jgi:ABC-type spermidine/putrescine transport system permease subunit I
MDKLTYHVEHALSKLLLFIFFSLSVIFTTYTFLGEKLWQFSNSTYHKRFTPGALILHNNRLFVADWSSHKVIELTLDGSHVRDVVTDNIEYPHALAVQRSQGRLYITQSNFFKQEARSRSIKVFEIK